MNVNRFRLLFLSALPGLALAGCATHAVEEDFGNSVRRMTSVQRDVSEERRVEREGISETLDAGYASRVLHSYRQDVGDGKRVQAPIQINVQQ